MSVTAVGGLLLYDALFSVGYRVVFSFNSMKEMLQILR